MRWNIPTKYLSKYLSTCSGNDLRSQCSADYITLTWGNACNNHTFSTPGHHHP